jgi:hypothetical protein
MTEPNNSTNGKDEGRRWRILSKRCLRTGGHHKEPMSDKEAYPALSGWKCPRCGTCKLNFFGLDAA